MRKKTRYTIQSAVIAALYVVLTYLQNFIFPESTSLAIQFRLSEALCVLAFFTPAAIPGLSIGCLLFNISNGQALPLDFLAGTLATAIATTFMWKSRSFTIKGYPLFGLLMPALWNALIVGWELSIYIGGGFAFNALCVAIGEAAVLLVAGTTLYYAIRNRNLERLLRL